MEISGYMLPVMSVAMSRCLWESQGANVSSRRQDTTVPNSETWPNEEGLGLTFYGQCFKTAYWQDAGNEILNFWHSPFLLHSPFIGGCPARSSTQSKHTRSIIFRSSTAKVRPIWDGERGLPTAFTTLGPRSLNVACGKRRDCFVGA